VSAAGATATDRVGGARGPSTVAVVGGGIAGLSAAWALVSAAPSTRVVVLEGSARFGGKLLTQEFGGRPVDLGPDAFVTRRPEAVELCRELGLGGELVAPASRTAYVWARGRLRSLPAATVLGVPTRLGPLARSGVVSPAGVARVALDALDLRTAHRRPRVGEDEAVAAITTPRLGREVTERLVDPLVGGIHAGDTRRMSAAAVFPALLDAAGRPGSLMRALRSTATATSTETGPVFLTVRGGVARLVDALVAALRRHGVELRTNASVERLAGPADRRWTVHTAHDGLLADGVVIATPATSAARLLAPVDGASSVLLGAIEYAHVTLVTLRWRAEDVARPLTGTGFLVPACTGKLITACTWLSAKWPELHRSGDVLLRVSAGRAGDDRAAQLPDDVLTRRVLDELGPMMSLRGAPIDVVVTRWAEGFPQYAVGHLTRVHDIERALGRLPGVALAGAALSGVGVPACIASGRRAAAAILGGRLSAETSVTRTP
jgi:protoporphyrinogen/coproporphyrinogen III oxidase